MVDQNDVHGLNPVYRQTGRTSDEPASSRREGIVNRNIDKPQEQKRRASMLDYVTEWNLLDNDSDEQGPESMRNKQ